jgi:nicotinamide mononucleotide transporter
MNNYITSYFKNITGKSFRYFAGWTKFDICWLVCASAAILSASVLTWDSAAVLISVVNAAGSLTGTWCVIAVNKQRVSNYLFGLINVVCLGYFYWRLAMYGMMAVNVIYFLPMQFIGFYMWAKRVQKPDVVIARWAIKKERIMYILLTIIGIFAVCAILYVFHGNLPLLDGIGTVGNVTAQILMNAALIDQWIFWILIDIAQFAAIIISVIHTKTVADIAMAIMYAVWLVNAVLGLKNWIKDIRK